MLCVVDTGCAASALLSEGVVDREPDAGRGVASGDGTDGRCVVVGRVGCGATGGFGADAGASHESM